MIGNSIIDAIQGVTKSWTKQRKAEEREIAQIDRRYDRLPRSRRTTLVDAAWSVMEEAYLKASSNGQYPAHARQIMYAARGEILDLTGKSQLDDQYFCQTLLPDYLREHQAQTADWDVVFDARGHFAEPHTKLLVPLGTLQVRDYLRDVGNRAENLEQDSIEWMESKLSQFPTCGPRYRFSAVLFIEKEGFMPLFEKTKLAERYDLAIMSTKELSVTASRILVDELCGDNGVPLLVLHDFDKAGFSILGTLQRDTRRYAFRNTVNVIDLGLRLRDVRQWNLQAEPVVYGTADPTKNLLKNGATRKEVAFLYDGEVEGRSSGRRVELNAFASGDFIAWIESKLKEHGIQKVIPDEETLKTAYQRAYGISLLKQRLDALMPQVFEEAQRVAIPETLAAELAQRLKENPAQPWDAVLGKLAEEAASGPST
jgi:hypothetical protein